jgi:hypothetical protein
VTPAEFVPTSRTAIRRHRDRASYDRDRVYAILDEVSAKVRVGGPIDDAEDMDLPVWAGVLPLRPGAGPPIPDGPIPDGAAQRGGGPAYLSQPPRWAGSASPAAT